jgi:transposase
MDSYSRRSHWLYKQRNAVERFFNKLNTSALLQHAMTNAMTTISLPSSSLHCEYGFDLLSR